MICSDRLSPLGWGAQPYGLDHPRPGWAEQDARQWERALGAAMADALADAGVRPGEIEALGVSGQLDGCVPTDERGVPVGPCLIWMDRRATDCMPELPDDVAARTGLVPDPGHMAAKIAWLARERPGAARYHQPVSQLVARLTGEHVFDHGLASTTMLYDLASRDYDGELLARFGIDRTWLPRIADATQIAGTLTLPAAARAGLREGVPVCVGTGDDFATPLGAGIFGPGSAACVLGTAEVVGALHPDPVIDCGGLVETHAYPGGAYFVENPGWLAGGSVTWLSELLGAGVEELDRAAGKTAAGAGGLTFVPALSGAMAPRWIPSARGVFHGFTPSHGRGHLMRALMEGCAFAMRDVLDRLGELGVDVGEIVLMGGGARSQTWAKIRADLTGLPVAVAPVVDTCPLGAAALAAVAVGAVPDLASAAAQLAGGRQLIDPDPDGRAALDEAYVTYRALFDALEPLWTGGA